MKKGTNSKKNYEVVLPFGVNFEQNWDIWKRYKKEQFNFTYKSLISEQSAINKLVELAQGREDIAIAIIRQSCENGWRGLFAIQTHYNGQKSTGGSGIRGEVNDLYSKRFGK